MEVGVAKRSKIPEERESIIGTATMSKNFTMKDGSFNPKFTLSDLYSIKIGGKKAFPLIERFMTRCENLGLVRAETFGNFCIFFNKLTMAKLVAVPKSIGWVLRPKSGSDRDIVTDLIQEIWLNRSRPMKLNSLFKGKLKRLSLLPF